MPAHAPSCPPPPGRRCATRRCGRSPSAPHPQAEALRAGSSKPLYFFFQVEDGIRDLTVTGVQTCALPIGTLPFRDAPEGVADKSLTVSEDALKPVEGQFKGGSAYGASFRQGATLVPRMLCLVERRKVGRLGGDPTPPYVASRRTGQEKEPWKSLAGVEHQVEAGFLRPVLLGESNSSLPGISNVRWRRAGDARGYGSGCSSRS